MHGDEVGAGVVVEVFGAGGELDAGVVVVKVASYGFEPEGAFEPPVAEEFGVEGSAEDGRDCLVEAGFEGFVDEIDEVGGVRFGALGGLLRVIGLLVAHVDVGAGDAPVAVTAGPAFFVEVEVDLVAGVAGFAGPDLEAGAGVAGEDGGGGFGFVEAGVGAVDVVGLVEGAVGGLVEGLGVDALGDEAAAELVGGEDAGGLFDEVGVDVGELEAGLGEGLLDADAVEAGAGLFGAGVGDGVVPEAGGTVAALGDPDAARVLADVADVGVDGGADLGADGLVGAEQGQVAVGGGAGDEA